MPKFYKIRGLCPGLDGLIVELSSDLTKSAEVFKMFDTNRIIGDRHVSFEFPSGGLKIGPEFLEDTDDPTQRQYAHDNPYGKFIRVASILKKDGVCDMAEFENAIQISVRSSHGRVLFTDAFFASGKVQEAVLHSLIRENNPIEDIVFELNDLKEKERNGQA